MAKNACPRCNDWILNSANYCHHCGFDLAGTQMAHSIGLVASGPTIRQTIKQDWRGLAITKTFPAFAIGGMAYVVAQTPEAFFIGASITLAVDWLGPGVHKGAIDWYNAQSMRLRSQIKKANKAARPSGPITVEHLDERGRPRFLNEFDERVTLEDLAWVYHRLMDGAKFSKRGICISGGVVSEKKMKILQDEFMRLGYARKLYLNADNSPIVLERQGKLILRWSAKDLGLDYFA